MKLSYLDDIAFLKDEFPELVAKSNDTTKRSRYISCSHCGQIFTSKLKKAHDRLCKVQK